MQMPWISLLGVMNDDPTVLDNLVIPTAADYADIADIIVDDPFVPDRNVFINYLLMETAELPLLYSDPAALKLMVGYWSQAQMPAWVALYKTLLYKYNPLWNKDGTIKERRDIAYNKTGNSTNTGTVVTDQDTRDTGTVGVSGSSSGSTEHQVTGYDTNSFSPSAKDVTAQSASQTTTNNLTGTNDVTVTNNLAASMAEGGTTADLFERTEQGNIGLTSSQELVRQSRELAAFNFYDYLLQAFKKQFCIAIW